MKKLVTLTLAAALMLASGCAKPVDKMWQASGGSRADATVEVAFIYNPELEIPRAKDEQALREAVKRCQAWGYADAEPFGMVIQKCQDFRPVPFGGMVCVSMMTSRKFQCLGRGDSQVK